MYSKSDEESPSAPYSPGGAATLMMNREILKKFVAKKLLSLPMNQVINGHKTAEKGNFFFFLILPPIGGLSLKVGNILKNVSVKEK